MFVGEGGRESDWGGGEVRERDERGERERGWNRVRRERERD